MLVRERLLSEEPELAGRTLERLRYQLYQIARRVPAGAVEKLRQIRIWVEEREPHHPCMAYHPSAGWLREHGSDRSGRDSSTEIARERRVRELWMTRPTNPVLLKVVDSGEPVLTRYGRVLVTVDGGE